jgi:two-component system response regulator (stage 0 sporulation protein F)
MAVSKILVVEDETSIREMLVGFLKHQGYTVSSASNGLEALEQVHKESPEIMLLDVNMPGMNGIEVLQQVRKQDKQLKIIMMSGTERPETIKSMMGPPVVNFLTKPFPLQKLKESIAKVAPIT